MANYTKRKDALQARWIHKSDNAWSGGGKTLCTHCKYGYSDGEFFEVESFNYCPNCGADMREAEPQKCEDCRHGCHWDSVVICDRDGQRHKRTDSCEDGEYAADRH